MCATANTFDWFGAQCRIIPSLRVFMRQLRKELDADPPNPRYLVTDAWAGYRFNPGGGA